MSNSDSHDSIPVENQPPEWLGGLKPASASDLKSSVFFKAGYEAATREYCKARPKIRGILHATAASVIIAAASGGLCFQLGSLHGQRITNSNVVMKVVPKDDGIEQTQEIGNADLDVAKRLTVDEDFQHAALEIPIAPMVPWWQAQLERWLPNHNLAGTFVGRGVEIGRIGARWDSIVITQSKHRPSETASPVLSSPATSPSQSLRSRRERQIQSLMNGTF